MKVRCVTECYWHRRHFQVDDPKHHGVYDVTLAPGEKLPADAKGNAFLVEIKSAEPKTPKKKADKEIADEL